MTIREAELKTKSSLLSYYDSREASAITDLLIEDLTGFSRVDRILHDRDLLTDSQLTRLQCANKYLLQKMPLQYVLGYAYFAGLKLKVNNQVLIPRPETEELVSWVSETINTGQQQALAGKYLLDIGTGSGCIPLALKNNMPSLHVMGCDISDGALGVARHNARLLGLDVRFNKIDILSEVAKELLPEVDYIVSNPPYIDRREKEEMDAHVLDYEPHLALFPNQHDEATVFYRRVSALASTKLRPGGCLFFEINPLFVTEIVQLLKMFRFSEIEVRKDLQGKERMVKAVFK